MHSRFCVNAFLAVFVSCASLAVAQVGVHCGTTSDATLSDCQTLTQNNDVWNSAFNTGNICTFNNIIQNGGIPQTAFNVACSGNCCVYVAGVTGGDVIDSVITQGRAAGLLGCGDTAVNKINGMEKFDDGSAVCLSDGNGCGDCFDDSDFAFTKKQRRSIAFKRER